MTSTTSPLPPSLRQKPGPITASASTTTSAPAARRTSTPASGPQRTQHPSSSASVSSSSSATAPLRAALPTRPPRAGGGAAAPLQTAPSKSAPTPTIAALPATLPRLPPPPVDKMAMAAVISPNPMMEAPKMSMTSKEWVIPPRPKPGRKPATDTPPTKRKAQNRAAQRAFRERRAARVGELEELMDQQTEVHEKEKGDLKEKIHDLELDVQSFRSRCMLLENMLERERQERIRTETEAEALRRRYGHGHYQTDNMSGQHQHHDNRLQGSAHQHERNNSIPTATQPQAHSGRDFSISQIISPPQTHDANASNDASETHLTCGNCTPTGRCACAEEVIASAVNGCGKCGFGTSCQCLEDMTNASGQGQDLKRPVSPSGAASNEKRLRSSLTTEADGDETDFNTIFSKKSAATSEHHPQYQESTVMTDVPSGDSMAFRDDCGFCKDGTYCVCADAAMAAPDMTPAEPLTAISHQIQTPPPSETDVVGPPIPMEMTAEGAVKLPPRRKKAKPLEAAPSAAPSGCGPNGPGTCAQCQADPKSGLFCRLMAAKVDREGGPSGGGCCGGKGADGGCCKVAPKQEKPEKQEKITLPSLPSLGLSCAEAYQTLSSHRNFEQAADDIGSWLPKLRATPNAGTRAAPPGRMPIEVEAASIMSVLKEFDVRFGREC